MVVTVKSTQDDNIQMIDSPQTEASRLLEAALQQMDGIISGVGLENVERGGSTGGVELATERLVTALQAYPILPPPPDPHRANIIRLWIQQLLITRRHHRVKKVLATLLEERDFTCLDEVYCIDSEGSPRFADIVAISKNKEIAYIVDPTVRYESNDREQSVKVDQEKKNIYEKCIPYLNEKLKEEFGDKRYVVRGLWFGSRGSVPPLTTSFFEEVGLDAKKLQDIAESIIIDSLGIIHHHLYGS